MLLFSGKDDNTRFLLTMIIIIILKSGKFYKWRSYFFVQQRKWNNNNILGWWAERNVRRWSLIFFHCIFCRLLCFINKSVKVYVHLYFLQTVNKIEVTSWLNRSQLVWFTFAQKPIRFREKNEKRVNVVWHWCTFMCGCIKNLLIFFSFNAAQCITTTTLDEWKTLKGWRFFLVYDHRQYYFSENLLAQETKPSCKSS